MSKNRKKANKTPVGVIENDFNKPSKGPNPAINKGWLFWGRFTLLVTLVVLAGLWVAAVVPNLF
ncbi:hypothetical protein HN670_03445 [bacterium]|jgi:hypothetical protein|nr:hypothetical protein [bacterium]